MTDRALTVWGARGSMAVSGKRFQRYGGNTTCYSVEVAPRHLLVVDAGTGLRSLERTLDLDEPHEFDIVFSHVHLDHVIGLPLFGALYDGRHRLTFHGAPREGLRMTDLLHGAYRPPWWPITIHDAPATTLFRDVDGPFAVGPLTLTPIDLHHPQGSTGYRIDGARRSIVIATDHEAGERRIDRRLAEASRGAAVLVHDAQYTPDEYRDRRGYGHSTWETAAEAAVGAGVKRLVLTSHDPNRSDEAVDEIVQSARRIFPMTAGAHEGMTIPL
ncbi:MAG: MBL fold metallo-hydrolase [Acidimicrobiia bacterium]|nr:MBL fold metallo-hydrolase [Acidimicrobiia bacterium]